MKLFIVNEYLQSDFDTVGVFSTKEDAEKAIDEHINRNSKEYIDNAGGGLMGKGIEFLRGNYVTTETELGKVL